MSASAFSKKKKNEIPSALAPKQTVELKKKAPQDQGSVPNFKILEQEERNWCWAAVAQSVKKTLDGRQIEQCDIIEITIPTTGCCVDHSTCKKPFFTVKALKKLNNLREGLKNPLRADQVMTQIPSGKKANARPIGCGLDDGEGAGHAVVIHGWDIINQTMRLRVGDPIGGVTNAEYLVYLTDNEGREWVETYKTKKEDDL